MNALVAQSHYIGERIDLDYRAKLAPVGSDEGLDCTERAMILKQKETQLVESVLDNLKLALETKLNEEDETNLEVAGFPTDTPNLKPEEMVKITAELFDKFQPEKHCRIADYMRIVLVQPWMALQAVEDIQLEDMAFLKGLEEDKVQTQLRAYRDTITTCDKKLEVVDKLVR